MNAIDAPTTDATTRVIKLASQYPTGQLGLPAGQLELSWQVVSKTAGSKQVGYEIQSAADADFTQDVVVAEAHDEASQFVAAPGSPTASRQVRYYRVRIQTQAGVTDWSPTLRHETGLIAGTDFVGSAIGDVSKNEDPAALLRKSFEVTKPVASARLYATAHGTFDLSLNGQTVGDEILAPGWNPYGQRLLHSTHDVSGLLVAGTNTWGVVLADGWYRGHMGFAHEVNNFGTQTSFLGQLEITYTDGTTQVVATDDTWQQSTGELRMASIYNGCDYNFSFAQPGWNTPPFDAAAWSAATVHAFDRSVIEPRGVEPVRVIKVWDTVLSQHNGATRVNVTQNISGWLVIKVEATVGTKLRVRHAEVLEKNGDLHTQALRAARATETYVIAADGVFTLEPAQTFHGFQFADIVVEAGSAKVLEVKAKAISTDIAQRSSIETSHGLLNKLVSNTYWSLRDNYVSIPTDCPQRDERLGWTGDAQAFAYAANTLVQGGQFYRNWLVDLEIEQNKLGGKVPMIIPDILSPNMDENHPFFSTASEAGWSDAATVIPWSVYERFGDLGVLRQQLASMRSHVEYNKNDHDGLLIPPRMALGDWLDPDAPEGQPWAAKVSGNFMANAYMARSVWILAKTEALMGNAAEAAALEERFAALKQAIWAEHGEAAAATPTGAAILLEFDLAPAGERRRIADSLAAGVRDTDGRIVTGFLGTPVILDALSRNGHLEEAYQMLLREKKRSWLYPITVGATTIWERWEAIHEDGSISAGGLENGAEGSEPGMISFNHYAYGAVVDWIERYVGGISPLSAGYQSTAISPRPTAKLTHSNSWLDTGYGRVVLDWAVDGGNFAAKLVVPFGVTAVLDLPAGEASVILVDGKQTANGTQLGHGEYQIAVSNAVVVGN